MKLLGIVAFTSLFFYWAEAQETIHLNELVDSHQDTIAEQQIEITKHQAEIQYIEHMLILQSDTIRQLDNELTKANETIATLEAEIDSYEFISDSTYKPWESRAELKDWLADNDVSEREFSEDYDCDDFAMALFLDALADNRLVPMREDKHRFNFADVGNVIYAIEPQTDKTEKDGRVD